MTIHGTQRVAQKQGARHLLASQSTHFGNKQLKNQSTAASYAVRVNPSRWPTRYERWGTRFTCESGRTLQQHEGWLSAAGDGDTGSKKISGTVNPADMMTKHLDGKRLVCDLPSIKHISGRPSSPKLTIDTELLKLEGSAVT